MDYAEKMAQEQLLDYQVLADRNNKRRENQKEERSEKYKLQQAREYAITLQYVREAKSRIAEAENMLKTWQERLATVEQQIANLVEDGFVIPQPAPAKPAAPKPTVKAPEPKDEPQEPYVSREYAPCPACGQNTPVGVAWHKFEDMPDIICVIDAKRTKMSGVPDIKIQAALERQKIAKRNKEN